MQIDVNTLIISGLIIIILSLAYGNSQAFKAIRSINIGNGGGRDTSDYSNGDLLQFILGIIVVIALLYFFSPQSSRLSSLFPPIQANPTGQIDSNHNKQVPPTSPPPIDDRKNNPPSVDITDLSLLDGNTNTEPPTDNIQYKGIPKKVAPATNGQRGFFMVPTGCYKKPDKAFKNLTGQVSLRMKVYVKNIQCYKVGYGPFNSEEEAVDFRRKHQLKNKPERYIWPEA